MATRIIPDGDKPSVAIEISLEKPLPDYDLEQLEQPTPRDIDGILVSQGFRDLVDDARGVLLQILSEPHSNLATEASELTDLHLIASELEPLEITQLTGAICPGDDEIYRPGLWIVLRDNHAPAHQPLSQAVLQRVQLAARQLVKRLDLS